MLEQIGINRHPSLRVVCAPSLIAGTGGHVDTDKGHVILLDLLKDDQASGRLKGLTATGLADSARLGRGGGIDVQMAKRLYQQAFEMGISEVAYNLGLYWEGRWNGTVPEDILPDLAQAIQWYRRGAPSSNKCEARLKILMQMPTG